MGRILLVDDERKIRRQIAALLTEDAHVVDEAEDGARAHGLLRQRVYDLMITDVRLPDRSGIDLLTAARALQPAPPVVLMTAYGTVEDAVTAMRLGAFDYIQKPFPLEALRLVTERVLAAAAVKAEHEYLLGEARAARGGPELIGDSGVMTQVRRLIEVAATQPATVLLTGESGTGKELVAEAVHRQSGNLHRPLVRLNCPAIPKALFESELFGHVKGAFTDARESRRGKFELARGGTLFLDEVSELPLELQAKLLRAIETRRFARVGSDDELQVDLRIIAATNRDLAAAVKDGRFRDDLYYRLKVFPIHLPPLRERREDLPALAQHLLTLTATQFHMGCAGISREALRQLQQYSWPGNVRELRNVLERGLLLARGEVVGLEHLPAELTTDFGCEPPECTCLRGLNEQVETHRRELLLKALKDCGWRKREAAESLGLSPRALSHYISKYDLDQHR